ncbi:hypothetical protein LAWI1_G001595 [Lachnellula willkommii]|uniref:BTB domain-containing protein n=1 Tax=Lachnellula willkommii TaxID=215461 RepID=A0A559MJG8_9HELO|nr:hypothetical protein LAWI1_G001595 [Lachnellula willkommii]
MASQGTKRKCEDEVLPFNKRMGTEMVNIYVGEGDDKEHFHVHKELLCNKIPYFEKMFKGGFQEATTNEARFPEDNPESFDLLLGWVYEGSLPPLEYLPNKSEGDIIVVPWNCRELYALCDKLCIPELMDKVMDMYRKFNLDSNTSPSIKSIEGIYSITSFGSVFRRYVATSFSRAITTRTEESWKIEELAELMVKVPDLARDVARIMREAGGKVEDPRKKPNCDFHTHQKDIPCPWETGKKAKQTS